MLNVVALLRREIPAAHPAFRLSDVTPQSTLVENGLVKDRLLALLSAFFSIVAIALVCVGLYGVLSYGVVQRTREIGIRMALGSRSVEIVRLIASDIGIAIAIGLVAGMGAALAVSRSIASLLYGVTPSDTTSIALPLTLLILACGLSGLVPAWRATRVDPMTALRCE
jgi:ABC-type antimicrobial peptide transport system permease subunit